MKPASAGLIALMTPGTSAKQWVHADLYTWTLVNGTVARYTSADINLTVSGNTFSAANALFKRGKTNSKLGLEVPTLDLEIYPSLTDLISGMTWAKAAKLGVLDGATVLVERFLSDAWTNLAVGTLYQFLGTVGSVPEFSRQGIKLTLVAPTKVLNQKLPRNLYQTTCVHTLYDGAVGVSGCSRDGNTRASKTVTGTVAAGSTVSAIKSNRTEADNYFNLGSVTFTSGANSGLQRSVDSYTNTNGLFNLTLPLPVAPLAGDTFTTYPGCNKVEGGDCTTKFANVANFKGTPDVPVAETAL